MSLFPDFYSSPHAVKSRLIASASPHLLKSNIHANISGGIVDPSLATLDPKVSWLKRKGKPEYKSIDIANWCTSGIKLVDPIRLNTQDGFNLATADILRIKRFPPREISPDKSTWIVWRKVRQVNGEVLKSAVLKTLPNIIRLGTNGDPLSAPLAKPADAHPLVLEDIDDLFIKGTNGLDDSLPCAPAKVK
jgi:hypothetical protein